MALMINGNQAIGAMCLDGYGNNPQEAAWIYAAPAGGINNSNSTVFLSGTNGLITFLTCLEMSHSTLSAETEYTISAGGMVVYRGMLKVNPSEQAVSLWFSPPIATAISSSIGFKLETAVTGAVYVNASGYNRK
jgi:hypothetical protein